MKQITIKQAEALAFAGGSLEYETKLCQGDWIRCNADRIADIEMKRCDKTLWGTFPNGWKKQMAKGAKMMARKNLLERFLRDECKLLDGAIWLGNITMIEQMEKETA
jgi:hypothetical protein